MFKDFINIDEQIKLLKQRGLYITNKDYAKKILWNTSYYNLINGYSDPFFFCKAPKRYKSGTTLSEILALFNFDCRLRSLLLTYILYIENEIKSKVVYIFLSQKDQSGNYLHSRDDYLNPLSFDNTTSKQRNNACELVNNLSNLVDDVSDTLPFGHYLNRYGYVPLFVLATRASLGQLSKFYSCMRLNERKLLSRNYDLTDRELRSMLGILTQIRNSAAHGNRLYCFSGKVVLPFLKKHSWANNILQSKRQNSYFDSVLISLKILLPAKNYNAFKNSFINELDILKRKLRTIKIDDIYKYLNLYNGWEKDI